jgi:hypothetical protein
MRSSPRVCRVWAENGTTLSVTTRDVVKVAHHASLANKLDISQSNGSNATAITCDHPRPRRRSIWRGYEWSQGVRQDMKLMGYERGRSLRKIHGEESIFMRAIRGSGLCRFTGIFTTRIFVAHGLQIDPRKRSRQSPRGFSYHRASSHG